MTVPKHHWSECRPALLSLDHMNPAQAEQHSLAVMAVWKRLPRGDRQAFHRVCCLNSRTPSDLQAIERIQTAMSEVL